MKLHDQVQDFTLLDDQGVSRSLSEFEGKKVVIYFYPKDATPGCTTQACEFRNNYAKFRELDIIIIGISQDSVESHKQFKEDHNLPFILLSDPALEVSNRFGVYQEKQNFGKTYMGIVRSTFVLDENHQIIKVFPKANPDTNALDIIDFVESI